MYQANQRTAPAPNEIMLNLMYLSNLTTSLHGTYQRHRTKLTKLDKHTAVQYQTRRAYHTCRANCTNQPYPPYQAYQPTVPTAPTNRTNCAKQPYKPYQPTGPSVRTRENTCTSNTVPYILEISLSPLAPILDLALYADMICVFSKCRVSLVCW